MSSFFAIFTTPLNLLSWLFAKERSPSSAVAKWEYNPSNSMLSIWFASFKKTSAWSNGTPNLVIPVSIFKWTLIVFPSCLLSAFKSSKDEIFKVKLYFEASSILVGSNFA